MKSTKNIGMICCIAGIALTLAAQPPAGGGRGFLRGAAVPFNYADNEGWTSLFDGKTLNGWKGNSQLWSVKDGSIYIHPSCEHPTGTTYIYWTGGEVADFVLKYEMKGNQQVNGGMQFRSYLAADANVTGRYPPRAARGPAAPPGGGRGAGRGP